MKTRVLHVVPNMNVGGLETFIMNIYRNIDRDKIQFDFLEHYIEPSVYDEEGINGFSAILYDGVLKRLGLLIFSNIL